MQDLDAVAVVGLHHRILLGIDCTGPEKREERFSVGEDRGAWRELGDPALEVREDSLLSLSRRSRASAA